MRLTAQLDKKIADAEQHELETMFGSVPEPEEFVTTRSLEL